MDITGLPVGPLTLSLSDDEGATIAATMVECSATIRSVVLKGASGEQAFRLISPDGDPLPGILWSCRFIGYTGVGPSGRSDDDGVCRVLGVDTSEMMLTLAAPSGAHSTSFPITLGPLDRPAEVVFDPNASLNLIVDDHGVPLDGVMLSIRDATTGDFLGWPTTDANGKATFGNVTEGQVLISPHATSIWYETVTIRTSATPTLETLEFRRIGSLTVTVLNAYGKPEVGAFVAITSDEYNTDVAEWLSEQRVTSAGGLVTDDEGQVHIGGLPNGAYTIYVRGESGAAVVPPLGEGGASIKLPPL